MNKYLTPMEELRSKSKTLSWLESKEKIVLLEGI